MSEVLLYGSSVFFAECSVSRQDPSVRTEGGCFYYPHGRHVCTHTEAVSEQDLEPRCRRPLRIQLLYRGTSLIRCGDYENGRVHVLKFKNLHETRWGARS